MLPLLARRLALAVLLVVALLTVVFFLVHAAPGRPTDLFFEPTLDEAGRELISRRLGLDQPLGRQYLSWLVAVLIRGDFGDSLRQHRPVSEILAEALPKTLILTLTAFVVYLVAGVVGGVLLARRRGRFGESVGTLGGLLAYSVPTFWLGLMLILLFSRWLGWLPPGGMHSVDADLLPWYRRFADLVRHLVLPVLVLGLSSAMGLARYVRTTLLEVLDREYIAAARARGLPERVVLWRHALRNCLLPVITIGGLSLPSLLGGSVVTETVFAWPGMGRVAVEAIWARDYPVIMAVTFLAGVLVVFGNLLADFLYSVADPRIRLDGEVDR